MEENILEVQDYSQYIQECKGSIQELNETVNKINSFLENEKKEQQQEEEENAKLQIEKEKELKDLKEQQQKEQDEFLNNIELIANNTDTETTLQVLNDVSVLMQTNIICSGILIGIVCISLFAKFFKR